MTNFRLLQLSISCWIFLQTLVDAQSVDCPDCAYYIFFLNPPETRLIRGYTTVAVAESSREQARTHGFQVTTGEQACSTYSEFSCGDNSVCESEVGNVYYSCRCKEGNYEEIRQTNTYTCRDVDECLNGTHDCDSTSVCHNIPGSFNCVCNNAGYSWNGLTCKDTDECASDGACTVENSKCVNSDGSFSCVCQEGYTQSTETADLTCIAIPTTTAAITLSTTTTTTTTTSTSTTTTTTPETTTEPIPTATTMSSTTATSTTTTTSSTSTPTTTTPPRISNRADTWLKQRYELAFLNQRYREMQSKLREKKFKKYWKGVATFKPRCRL